MRRTRSVVTIAALAFGVGGCLSTFVPDHHASTSSDGGTAQSTGGGGDPGSGGGGSGGGGGGGSGGGGGGSASDMGSPSDGAIPNDPNCIQVATPVIDGHHNAGMACLTCHDGNTAGANRFYAAGTVYDIQTTPSKPVTGATIELIDANGTKVTVVTASQGAPGNFWTQTPLVFPVQVRASRCPFDRPMPTKLAAGATPGQSDGNCARAGCHDANNVIHVP